MKPNCIAIALALTTGITSGLLAQTQPATQPNLIADGGNAERGNDMAPDTRPEVVEAAVAMIPAKLPPGPVAPSWESIRQHYSVPQWLNEAKFGIFIHWGLYAVPAYHNEWYEKHMYSTYLERHTQTFGPPEKFGYKDFIAKFTCERFDANEWASLFARSGARFVMPAAQHHDNFAMWDSDVTRFSAGKMGPKRDLIGDLAKAVRAHDMKFALSNHGIENFQFINPSKELLERLRRQKADLFDPEWLDFYNVADRSDEACKRFLVDWALRNVELIEKYQPDMLWFDNGIDQRMIDPLKLWLASYYYNRAVERGQAVTLVGKKAAFSPTNRNSQTIGAVIDFEKVGSRSPAGIRTGCWMVDDPIASNSWGYIEGLQYVPTAAIIRKIVDTASKNGTYVLNISPRADGSIPDEQRERLLEIGEWFRVNGEAIYGSHNWTTFGEDRERGAAGSKVDVRFTVKGGALYAILLGEWPGESVVIRSLRRADGSAPVISAVTMLGTDGAKLAFEQTDSGLVVHLPPRPNGKFAYTLKIEGLDLNGPTATRSGNPE